MGCSDYPSRGWVQEQASQPAATPAEAFGARPPAVTDYSCLLMGPAWTLVLQVI